MKSKIVAGVLGILLGGIGAHRFYLGRICAGIFSILFFWTGIPGLVGVIEGIIYLLTDERKFLVKYCKMKEEDLPQDSIADTQPEETDSEVHEEQ